MIPAPGTVMAGYRVERPLGRGGMGAVFLATHEQLERHVALKLLTPELAEDRIFRDRFIAESRLAASLDHPHILPIYEAGDVEGQLFLAMRYVEGPDLAALIRSDGRLEPRRVVAILAGVADALDAAHDRGLIHRDVKPANILIAGGPRGGEHAYLTDFGVTKRLGSTADFTRPGTFVGSVGYSAPEQIQGKPIDGRVDVYSLACVLFECLTGRLPFAGDSEVATLWAHVNTSPPKLSEIRPELAPLDAVVAKGLAKAPEDRYATAAELINAVAAEFRSDITHGFLFADLRGYTRYVEQAGNQAGAELLARFRKLVREQVARFDGAEIKTEGDSFYVVFPSASRAAQCGVAIVSAVAAASAAEPESPMRVGVGIHAGEAVETSDGGFIGSAVNIAARLCAVAGANEVLVSETVRELVRTSSRLVFKPAGKRTLKGVAEPVTVWTVVAPATARPVGPSTERTKVVVAPLDGSHRRIRVPLAAAGIVGVVVLAGAVLFLASRFILAPGQAAPGGPQSPQATQGAPVVVAASSAPAQSLAPSALDATLLQRVPSSLRGACAAPAPTAEERPLGSVAMVVCQPQSEPPRIVRYSLFTDGPALAQAFNKEVQKAQARTGATQKVGVCFGAPFGPGYEPYEYGQHTGDVLCYVDPGAGAVLAWTIDGLKIYAIATRPDGNPRALYDWWIDPAQSFPSG